MGAVNGWVQDFWWRRRTDPPPVQPPRHVEFKTPDANSTLWNTRKTPGTSRWASRAKCCFESFPPPSKDHVSEALAGENETAGSAVDRLQETIRFVFSHEQEGLLAIGTFALDQLAGVRVDYDVNQLIPPESVSTTNQNICQLNSTSNSEFQSETGFQPSSLSRNNLERPVFGDHDALSDLLPVVEATKTLPIASVLEHNSASTFDSSTSSSNLASTFDSSTGSSNLASNVDSSTGSSNLASTFDLSPGSSNLDDTECTTDDYQSDEEVCIRGICGLFGFRSRSREKLSEKENRKQVPPEKEDGVEKDAVLHASVKIDRSKEFKISSLGRLWRLGRGRPPPFTNQASPTAVRESTQVPGVPCIANVELGGGPGAAAVKNSREVPRQPVPCAQKTGEGGERIRRASFGSGARAFAQMGKWIRTDSEFVVLEM